MSDTDSPAKPGRPPDLEKRRAILAATRAVFLRSGVAELSIEAVALDAGVSKVTIYKQFGDRAGLMTALVGAESDWMEATFGSIGFAGPDFAVALTMGCQRLMAFLLRRDVMDFDAQMQLAAVRHPDLVARFVAAGPDRLHAALADALRAGPTGESSANDAVGTLMGLLFAVQPPVVRFGLAPPLPEDARDAAVALAVQRFLTLYAT
jgi:TetR/AcrR family transcriptional regulator, mexJK operon transcriptional repressor